MIINIHGISGIIDCVYKNGSKNIYDNLAKLLTDVSIRGEYSVIDKSTIKVVLTTKYSIGYACAKCLAPVVVDYSCRGEETFNVDSTKDNQIDLTDMIDEIMVLNMDSRVLCNSDCKGLCICGVNLNTDKCKCEKIEDNSSENAFAKLIT